VLPLCPLWELGSLLVLVAHIAPADFAVEKGEHGFFLSSWSVFQLFTTEVLMLFQ